MGLEGDSRIGDGGNMWVYFLLISIIGIIGIITLSIKKQWEWLIRKSFSLFFGMLFLLVLFLITPGVILISLITAPEETTDVVIEVWYTFGLIIIAMIIYGFIIEIIISYYEYKKSKKRNQK